MSDELRMTAYTVGDETLDLVPATVRRTWMDNTDQKFANRCLPLLLANQSGWFAVSKHRFRAIWDGGPSLSAITIQVLDDGGCGLPCPALSHFGYGVLTWHVPWLFRLPEGWDLMVKGPANWPKDAICALEGLVETDWAPMTFTMNWLFTSQDIPVYFNIGDPVCMLAPERRGDLEKFRPEIRKVSENPELHAAYEEWATARDEFNAGLASKDPEIVRQGWQRSYFRGYEGPGDHQTRRKLKPFK